MNNNLDIYRLFSDSGLKDKDSFYYDCFSKLKQEFNFACCALFYKNSGKYQLKYKLSFSKKFDDFVFNFKKEQALFKLKIPIKVNDSSIGCFLFIRETPFSKEDKYAAAINCKKLIDEIKDFEISKVFQYQLVILQEAILQKNEATKKLEEKNNELIETDKIRSKFLANVSHELRTPLNSIIGFSTALRDEMIGSLNIEQKKYANKILSSAIHLTGLINDILDMSRIESNEMKVDLKLQSPEDIILEVINIIEPLANEKNIKIETKFKFNGDIFLDYIKFRQIIYNLAGNAIKFSHKNSKIIISTEKRDYYVYITVKDFGVGIDKKNQKRIFDKFVQLDNIYTKTCSSTGLGLTITDELVKLHNGKIILKSSPNKGSSFCLKFEAPQI